MPNYVNPTATYPGDGTHPGRLQIPNDGEQKVNTASVTPGFQGEVNGDAFNAALALGRQFTPPLAQPPSLGANPYTPGRGSGVARVQWVQILSDLAALPGMLNDLVWVPGYGFYTLILYSNSAADGLYLINRTSTAWSSGAHPAVGSVMTHDSGRFYLCTQINPAAATGTTGVTGPAGTGAQGIDGDVQWVYSGASGAPLQWAWIDQALLGANYGLAQLDSGGLVPFDRLPANAVLSTYSANELSTMPDSSWHAVTDGGGHNIDATITTHGRSVSVGIESTDTTNGAKVFSTATDITGKLKVYLGIGLGNAPSSPTFGVINVIQLDGAPALFVIGVGPIVGGVYTDVAGVYKFTLMYKFSEGTSTAINGLKLVAREIL